MHFKLTQEMKQRIIVYSTSFIIAILFFYTPKNYITQTSHSVYINDTISFPSWNWIGVYIKQSTKMG